MNALSVDVEPDFPPHYNTAKGVLGLDKICGTIREHGGDATFFVCGEFLDANPGVLDVIGDFEVGCHGFRHIDLTRLTEFQLEGEFREALEVFGEHGIRPKGFRASYAWTNYRVLKVASRFFEYDSSLSFRSLGRPGFIREVPLFLGGKFFGVSPVLFNLALKTPISNKVFFVHPWEYGGLEFEKIAEKRRWMLLLGYSKENYLTNLVELLKENPVRVAKLMD